MSVWIVFCLRCNAWLNCELYFAFHSFMIGENFQLTTVRIFNAVIRCSVLSDGYTTFMFLLM